MRKELDLDLLDKTLKSVENMNYADIRVNESDNTVIVMKDGKSGDTIRFRSRYMFVCFKHGAWGFSYTNQLNRLTI